ncbi:alpha-2-macroglobulin family protein [Pedobacter sp. UBA5917]|uniref:alpha-2-macroglobulin family protein n=1 Tax=Pedobacter sp. UBA5917 TaxID=1947061 RepID=UPI0025D54645|nr:alpha-2-macroglobulin family protein [Pedobacter sp. UBA5917]
MKNALQSIITFLIFFTLSFEASAQNKAVFYKSSFKKIDSLASAAKPKDGLALVEKVNTQARLDGNTPTLIKSVMYRMLFVGYLEEDAFLKMIKQLKEDIKVAKQPAKSILQSLLAESYWSYYEQHYYNSLNRTNVKSDLGDDIKTWSMNKLTEESMKYYLASLQEIELLQKTKIDSLSEMMTGDNYNRYLRPKLYDVLAHRALTVFSNTRYDIDKTDEAIDFNDAKWFGDHNSFLAINIPQKDSTSFNAKALGIYQVLIKMHANTQNIGAVADADLKRLNYVYLRSTRADKNELYYQSLQKLAGYAERSEIYADVLFQLASKKYEGRYAVGPDKKVDLKELIEIANRAIKAYPNSIGAKNSEKLIADISQKTINFSVNEFIQPGKPAQLYFRYRNVDTVYLKLYKPKRYFEQDDLNTNKETYNKFLAENKAVKQWAVILPDSNDYQEHTLMDKIESLEIGRYVIIAQSTLHPDDKNSAYNFACINVTNLAVTNRISGILNHQYFVANSTTGEPVEKAVIKEKQGEYANGKYVLKGKGTIYTDKNGFAESTLNISVNRMALSYRADSVILGIQDRIYRNLSTNEKVVIFTDRPIYRPGQTVYYKGIYFEYKNDKNHILKEKSVDITFKDVNWKEIEKTAKITNEYGTFQGSFTIPIGKLNGQMSINTAYGSAYIQVEEYKRPTFEIVFDKLNKKYKLGDSISVGGKALSFAGYAVSGARVKYTINRNMLGPNYMIQPFDRSKQIASGTTETKTGGVFNIDFLATVENDNVNGYSYQLQVDITDVNGETKSKAFVVSAAKNDVLLHVFSPTQFFPSPKNDSITFRVTNINGEPIKAKINTEWFKLASPERIIYPNTNPNIKKTEKYNITKAEFLKDFPNEDYDGDGTPANWKAVKIDFAQQLNSDLGTGEIAVNTNKISSGYYKIRFKATNQDQDTVTVERIVRVYGSGLEKILLGSEWLVAEKTTITPKEAAVFRLASVAPNAKAYYEVYYKDQVAEKKWISITQKQTSVNIKPLAGWADGFAVQFTLVQNGRISQSMNEVAIIDKEEDIEIKFLTFRDKLQPGEKENWKLSISNKKGEKQMAEMVASLYDASLDDLRGMNWDKIRTPKYNYYNYNWKYTLNNLSTGDEPWFLKSYPGYYEIIKRDYESINFYGFRFNHYDFKAGYNQYLAEIEATKRKGNAKAATEKLAKLKLSGKVYGVVTDKDGYGIPGALVKSGNKKATADSYGIYSIDAKVGEEISAGFLGYNRSFTKVRDVKRINFKLEEDGKGLNEVSVVAYGSQKKTVATGSVQAFDMEIRQELAPQSVVLREIRTKGVGYTADGAPLPELLKDKLVVVEDNKVYDFVSINGYDAKTGTQYVNGKRIVKPAVTPRTNFNETAFFYPQLQTNAAGEIFIEFTIPQSLTRYKMMGFAHTKDLKTALITKELVTQKQLSISANAPRFFREGDTISFSAKLNNLSGKQVGGDAVLMLKDALTGKEISVFAKNVTASQKFQLANNGNQSLKWSLVIPSGIGAITYRLVAQSASYSDGEENTIPVLPNAILVTETMPVNVRGNSTKTFNFEKLEKSGDSKTLRNQSLTFEFTSNPVWYAVQALPYLMEYPYECAEQTFSRFYANSFATGIINSSPKIKTVFEQWKNTNNGEALLSNLEKNQELKSILLEETPWVRNADNETERKKRLAVLFDLNKMIYELKSNFEKLQKMQYNNGAFPWFSGMQEDRYITQHIVLGMGQLKKLKLIDEKAYPGFNTMLNKAIVYLDAALVKDYKDEVKGKRFAYLPLHYLFARSYTDQKNSSPDFVKTKEFYLKKLMANWKTFDTYQLAQTALVLNRNGNNGEAKKIITLLNQTAQQNDEMGMYWATNKAGWWWYQSPVETQSLLIEAYDEVAKDIRAVEEMKIWLLKNKQTNDWKTTKATAAACYALLMRGTDLLSESKAPEITIGAQKLEDLQQPGATKEAGTGYQKTTIPGTAVKPEMGKVVVKNNNQNIAWGALYWQYFEQLDKITSANTGIRIKKQLFLQSATNKGNELTPLTATNVLTPGDLLKVRIEIYCDRDMEYLHLKDMRSSGFEPVNVISQYKYQDGLGYYESTKDVSTNFFISYMPKGTYVFEYPLRVTHAGNFSNGITSLQSMYAPEFTTHSAGIRVTVK